MKAPISAGVTKNCDVLTCTSLGCRSPGCRSQLDEICLCVHSIRDLKKRWNSKTQRVLKPCSRSESMPPCVTGIAARILSAEPNAFQRSARIPERPRFKESCAASPQSACRCQCICDFREKVCVLAKLALGPATEPELLRAAFDASCFLGAFPPDPESFKFSPKIRLTPGSYKRMRRFHSPAMSPSG